MSTRTPSYRLHRPTRQAVVTLNGRDYYLGRHGSPESRTEYDRLIAQWLVNGRQVVKPPNTKAGGVSINELMLGYIRFADGYYRKGGEHTKEYANIGLALRPLKRLYGLTLAEDFGPLALKAVRQDIVNAGICRLEVNRRIGRIVRAFKWGVENELVSPTVYQALKAVPWLRKGRTEARESKPVKPVADAVVDAVQPHVPRQVWAMIELQRLTGMRPGEVCLMRTCDLDMSGAIWGYTPASHKTEHHDKERRVYLGPRAQAILRPWLKTSLTAYLFSPAEAMDELRVARRQARKTKVQPSQLDRRKRRPRKSPGDRYTADSYRQAIARGCDKAFPCPALAAVKRKDLTPEQRTQIKSWRQAHRWHPNQLRHTAATCLRKEFGLDAARVILGHSSPATTQIYAEIDRDKAAAIMGEVG